MLLFARCVTKLKSTLSVIGERAAYFFSALTSMILLSTVVVFFDFCRKFSCRIVLLVFTVLLNFLFSQWILVMLVL